MYGQCSKPAKKLKVELKLLKKNHENVEEIMNFKCFRKTGAFGEKGMYFWHWKTEPWWFEVFQFTTDDSTDNSVTKQDTDMRKWIKRRMEVWENVGKKGFRVWKWCKWGG